jgi:hypothetical protein
MENINTFSNGQNSDLSKQIPAKNTYLQALNFRPLTELGGSNGALVNIKGNECSITFPDLQAVYKLQLIKGTDVVPNTTNNVATVTVNGTTVGTLEISNSTRGIDLYNHIIDNYPNCYQYTGTTVATKTFSIAYEDDYVVFYSVPVFQGCSPTASVATTVSISYSESTGGTKAVFKFINTNKVAPSLSQNTTSPYVSKVLSNKTIPIGSTFILDDIYILTAPDSNTYGPAGINGELPDNDTFGHGGAIWKLNIDDITKASTLTLIYSNNIDFTKYHPIAPSAILGRYESANIQRIYWTDFYNKIRNINVAQPQLMAMNPAQLYVFPSVSFEVPLLDNIGAGNLSAGTYELCYRLKKAAGAVTNYSQTSNMVHIINENPNDTSNTNYKVYEGNGGASLRSITWKVSNLDTSYDTIEYVILHRTSKTKLPLIYVKPEISIGLLVDNYITITDLSTYDTIELDEFLNLATGFTHAKTVDTKDNRLFWGNVKYAAQSDISAIFDARAFRAKTSGADDIYLSNNGIAPTPYTSTTAQALAQTEDCINEYYDTNGDESSNACFYKPGTSVLGGKGRFISYEFGTETIKISDLNVTKGDSGDYLINPEVIPPFSNQPGSTGGISGMTIPQDLLDFVAPSITTDSENQTYPIQGVPGFKNPYVTSVMKGFQQEEIYRLGIQFFDLQGNPFFTEWIGDIKMPSTGDTNSNPSTIAQTKGITDFRNSFEYNDNIYGQILYVKFTIDISTIKDFIGGYQIVRVERTESDKTILGCGIITQPRQPSGGPIVLGGGFHYKAVPGFMVLLGLTTTATIYMPNPSQRAIETLCPDYTVASNDGETGIGQKVMTFDSFDLLLNGYNYRNGDKLLIRSRVKAINRSRARSGVANPRYRLGFDNLEDWLNNEGTNGPAGSGIETRGTIPPSNNGTPGNPHGFVGGNGSFGPLPCFNTACGKFQTAYDSDEMPYYLLFYVEEAVHASTALTNYDITEGSMVAGGNNSVTVGGYTLYNHMKSFGNPGLAIYPSGTSTSDVPGWGCKTVAVCLANNLDTSISGIGKTTADTEGNKLIALYYRPNLNQYGGNTYAARTNSIYIPCGSFVPLKRINETLKNNLVLDINCFGGDIHMNYWDLQKISKNLGNAPKFAYYPYDSTFTNDPGNVALGFPSKVATCKFNISVSYLFPCTNQNNQAMRFGEHIDTQLTNNLYSSEDQYGYPTYHSNEKNVVTFFPKPLNFQVNDVWRNRVFFSEIKFDNEIEDSWSKYLTNNFYDVEGNYGQIMALVSLKEKMYYLQERGIGELLINPVSMINDSAGTSIKLGNGTDSQVIQKHFYKAIDTGTSHQWSVYRSQSAISFVDARHKKIYTFNGEGVSPISDIKGQRNFVIKRLHDDILKHDNPIINKGILTTYDYYHNEFLYTFLNIPDTIFEKLVKQELLTLAYSEVLAAFTGMYNFTPNLYINSNKYLLSTNRDNKVWFHNYGPYGNFYNVQYPSTLKILLNEQPLLTKVLDNLTWMSEAIDDNLEFNDDLNVYPGSPSEPSLNFISYSDDVNKPFETFSKVRVYNQYQNTDWVNLTIAPDSNLRKVEQGFNLQVPRNKFNYDTTTPSIASLFDPGKLTKTTFGERIRDKWMMIDLYYNNSPNVRFIIHNLKSIFRVSDR